MKMFATKQDERGNDCLGSFNTKRLDARLSQSNLQGSVQNDFNGDFKQGDTIRVYRCPKLGTNEQTLFFVKVK